MTNKLTLCTEAGNHTYEKVIKNPEIIPVVGDKIMLHQQFSTTYSIVESRSLEEDLTEVTVHLSKQGHDVGIHLGYNGWAEK